MKKKFLKRINLIVIVLLVAIVLNALYIYRINNLEKYINDMKLIQKKVKQIQNNYLFWENYNPTEGENFLKYLENLGLKKANSDENEYKDKFEKILLNLSKKDLDDWDQGRDSILINYFYFSPDDIKSELNLYKVNLHVIINFYTGNVISLESYYDVGLNFNLIHRQYDSKIGNDIEDKEIILNNTVKINVKENYGEYEIIELSFEDNKLDIKDAYYYMNDNDEAIYNCNTLSNYYADSINNVISFKIDKSGKYSFILKDINGIEYAKKDINISLVNPPKLIDGMKAIYWDEDNKEVEVENISDPNWYNYAYDSLKFANAKTIDGNYYVWIPRFTYLVMQDKTEIEFLKGTTSVSYSNEVVSYDYTIDSCFNDLTGFWISKYQINYIYDKAVSKPGKTLHVTTVENAINIVENNVEDYLKSYSTLQNSTNLNVLNRLSEINKITIGNNTKYYSGGSKDESSIFENLTFSNTNNIYGVFDLKTSEKEISNDLDPKTKGRYRVVLNIK